MSIMSQRARALVGFIGWRRDRTIEGSTGNCLHSFIFAHSVLRRRAKTNFDHPEFKEFVIKYYCHQRLIEIDLANANIKEKSVTHVPEHL